MYKSVYRDLWRLSGQGIGVPPGRPQYDSRNPAVSVTHIIIYKNNNLPVQIVAIDNFNRKKA